MPVARLRPEGKVSGKMPDDIRMKDAGRPTKLCRECSVPVVPSIAMLPAATWFRPNVTKMPDDLLFGRMTTYGLSEPSESSRVQSSSIR